MPETSFSSAGGLFGPEIARLLAQWRAAGRLLLELPLVRALAPETLVRCISAGGQHTYWRLRHGQANPAGHLKDFEMTRALPVVLLARSAVLERTLTLPQLSPTDLEHAVELEVQASTPFSAEQTVYGWQAEADAASGGQRVLLAITSRQQCTAALSRAAQSSSTEIWLEPDAAAPTIPPAPWQPLHLRGWGGTARRRAASRTQWRLLALLALALALAAALAVTPTAFLRLKAIQAQKALEVLQREAAPQLAAREALGRDVQALHNAASAAQGQVLLAPVLDMLTVAVPDGAWLSNLRLDGERLRINGMADDAAALVQRLAAQPGVADARLASPATRGRNDNKERFAIELLAGSAYYGPLLAASGAAQAASAP